MLIRQARKEDLNDVLELYKQLDEYHRKNVPNTFKVITDEWRAQNYLNCLMSEEYIIMVAEIEEKVVGLIEAIFTNITNHPIKFDKRYLLIDNLVIHKNYRRSKIASKLYQYIEDIGKEMSLDYIELKVYDFNDAKYFYEQIGFYALSHIMKKDFK